VKAWAPALAGAGTVLCLAALLQAAIALDWVSGFVVARPSEVIAAFPSLLENEGLAAAFLTTFGSTFAAAAIAAALGIPLGYFLYRRPLLDRAWESWIGALFSAPMVLFYPAFLVVFGRSVLVGIAMGAVVAFIPVVLKTREGFLGVSPVLIKVARSFGADERAVLRKVLLPGARAAIFTGLRLALIYAMINVVGIEFLANLGGLGYLVGDMFDRYEIAATYAATLCVIVASALFYLLTGRLERWLSSR
jgi:ABC-type nitrate/sulfonate/bicarbonate transport system permease component